jgi:hypothetical protein
MRRIQHRGRTLRSDTGSVLILMPACVLVVLVLAAIAVDMSLVHLRQRQAFDVAASAANDAVTAGADPASLRAGTYHVPPPAARAVVEDAVAISDLSPHVVNLEIATIDPQTVEVVLTVEVDHLFTGVIPGAPRRSRVTATASASAHEL